MPPPVLKKHCKRCEKTYLTYEFDKDFCTDVCKHKHAYAEHFNIKDELTYSIGNCLYCGEESRKKYCNLHCEKAHQKEKRVENSITRIKNNDKPRKNGLSYEELNRRAEWKRVFDDGDYLYRNNRERI